MPIADTERTYKSLTEGVDSDSRGSNYNLAYVRILLEELKMPKLETLTKENGFDINMDILEEFATFLTVT